MARPIALRPLAFLDTETTGLTPGKHEIIEIAIIKDFPVTGAQEAYHTLVRPEHIQNAEEKALACNGYGSDPSPWENAPLFSEISEGLMDFLEGTVIVGYNVRYDVAMINESLAARGNSRKIRHHNVDVMALCFEHLVPLGLTSLKMDDVREFLGWSKDGAHRAMKDVEDLERLYRLLHRMSWWGQLKIRLGRFYRSVRR